MARLPVHQRVDDPPQMRLTDRDRQLLETIDRFEGLLGDYQIARLFFTGVNSRTVRDRLKLLYQNGYIERPTKHQRGGLPCMIYWLAERGMAYVAGLRGEVVDKEPKPPRWGLVEHDLAVNDIRIAILSACSLAGAKVEEWVSSRDFWANPDEIRYQTGVERIETRKIRPDGYGVINYQNKVRSRLLIEVDRATEDNPRFVREKVIPGIAYIRSDTYRARFGANAGRWLVITTSDRRVVNMRRQAESASGPDAKVFHFTTFERVKGANFLTDPIWSRPGIQESSPLFELQMSEIKP